MKHNHSNPTGNRFSPGTVFIIAMIILLCLTGFLWLQNILFPSAWNPFFKYTSPPLAMTNGDPYIRALMRTISASESGNAEPYSILYGGSHITNLARHPNRCITITRGPNQGKCSTAAGRYQMLGSTWREKAEKYHPVASKNPKYYDFSPTYQDQVVHAWLQDSSEWNADIPALLRQDQLDLVLQLLSKTWTSLGYGIENNRITRQLPRIYQQVLKEELNNTENTTNSKS